MWANIVRRKMVSRANPTFAQNIIWKRTTNRYGPVVVSVRAADGDGLPSRLASLIAGRLPV